MSHAEHSNEPPSYRRENIRGKQFTGDLVGADFREARAARAIFSNTHLAGADFRGADLTGANLSEAKDLFCPQLGACILTGAELPRKIEKFEGVEHVKELSMAARAAFLPKLIACAYVWLAIGSAENAESSTLPILDVNLSIVGFYCVAPILLFALYCYCCLCLQRLWESLADLPAVFPDGVRLDKKVDPWLLNGVINTYVLHLRADRPSFSRLQFVLGGLLAYFLVPITLIGVWVRCLGRFHMLLMTGIQVILLAASAVLAVLFIWLGRATLRGWEEEGKPLQFVRLEVRHLAVALSAFLALATVSGYFSIK